MKTPSQNSARWLILIRFGLPAVYLSVAVFLFLKIREAQRTQTAFWLPTALGVWVLLGGLLLLFVWDCAQRRFLPPIAARATVKSRTVAEDLTASGRSSLIVPSPLITFEAPQDGIQMTIRRPMKYFQLLRCGDTGTLLYKRGKRKVYFFDFIRDNPETPS